MVDEVKANDLASLRSELEQALSALDIALSNANLSLSTLRDGTATILQVAEQAIQMEAAIARARHELTVSFAGGVTGPSLVSVPAQGSGPAWPAEASADEPQPSPAQAAPEEPDQSPVLTPESIAAASRCFRLGVISKTGSLDLKEVDSSVNENPAVTDVALLDYDGRQATLKLWINDEADAEQVREDLLSSLRTHLGEREAELTVNVEEEAA